MSPVSPLAKGAGKVLGVGAGPGGAMNGRTVNEEKQHGASCRNVDH